MGLFQVSKPKSAPKRMIPGSKELQEIVLTTLAHVAEMVGQTLGPGGNAVLIERGEMNMRPIITKDGVTVMKSLGFRDPVRQLILESARDAALRTASEAGDGTTTASILSESIARMTAQRADQDRYSPQQLVREMQALVPLLNKRVDGYKLPVTGEAYADTLLKVASLSANGDHDLAAAVVEALDTVGEEGNMTIVEVEGPSRYAVSKIKGYTVDSGYEESCKSLASAFVNDRSGTLVTLTNPTFLMFDGVVTDTMQVLDALNKLVGYMDEVKRHDRGVVLVAHGFADTVVGDLQVNWSDARSTVKVYPMITPKSAIRGAESQFLYDLQAYTGCPVYNPISRPLRDLDPSHVVGRSRATFFEAGRFRSSVIADEDEFAIEVRLGELKQAREKAESQYEARELDVRIGKLTSGIARLEIYGLSAGETREKRDRADDAWCAVRGAIRAGTLPGGGYVLVRLSADLTVESAKRKGAAKQAAEILAAALLQPVRSLYRNYGYKDPVAVEERISELLRRDGETYDLLRQEWVPKDQLLDSAPAVTEAIANSLSIASLLGTLGGVVAFDRDSDADLAEQQFARRFERATGENS